MDPNQISLNEMAPNGVILNKTASNRIARNKTVPNRIARNRTVPNRVSPKENGSEIWKRNKTPLQILKNLKTEITVKYLLWLDEAINLVIEKKNENGTRHRYVVLFFYFQIDVLYRGLFVHSIGKIWRFHWAQHIWTKMWTVRFGQIESATQRHTK